MELNVEAAKHLVKLALKEDIGSGDITTAFAVPNNISGRGRITFNADGVVAGLKVAELVFKEVDRHLKFSSLVADGEKVSSGKIVAQVEGTVSSILTGERVALNFLQRLSGIATLTNRFVEKVKPYGVKILDTRKTTPGWRELEKYAVKVGGGENHRMGLYDMVLIKENHLKSLGDSTDLAKLITDVRRKAPPEMKIEVEVESLEMVEMATKVKVDIIMLDNMSLEAMQEAVSSVKRICPEGRPLLEASGKVSFENVAEVAKTGVDLISVGALTHSPKALDISMEVEIGHR